MFNLQSICNVSPQREDFTQRIFQEKCKDLKNCENSIQFGTNLDPSEDKTLFLINNQFDKNQVEKKEERRPHFCNRKGVSDAIQKIIKVEGSETSISTCDSETDEKINPEKYNLLLKKESSLSEKIYENDKKYLFKIPTKSTRRHFVTQDENVESKKSKRKVEEIIYSYKEGKTLYKITGEDKEFMTREEILSEDPSILLYFYENHLKFAKTSDFGPAKMKKVKRSS